MKNKSPMSKLISWKIFYLNQDQLTLHQVCGNWMTMKQQPRTLINQSIYVTCAKNVSKASANCTDTKLASTQRDAPPAIHATCSSKPNRKCRGTLWYTQIWNHLHVKSANPASKRKTAYIDTCCLIQTKSHLSVKFAIKSSKRKDSWLCMWAEHTQTSGHSHVTSAAAPSKPRVPWMAIW